MSARAGSPAIQEFPTLMQSALRERWHALPPELQALHRVHDVRRFTGTAQVTRGRSPIARLAAWFFGFPPTAERVPVTVTKTRTATGEIWERDFGGRVFRSYLRPARVAYRVRERFRMLEFELDLPVADGCLRLPVHRGWIFGVPLPRWLLPISDSREYAEDGVFHFDVALAAPLGGGSIVRYRGELVALSGQGTQSGGGASFFFDPPSDPSAPSAPPIVRPMLRP